MPLKNKAITRTDIMVISGAVYVGAPKNRPHASAAERHKKNTTAAAIFPAGPIATRRYRNLLERSS